MNSNTPTLKLGEDVINQIKDFEPIYSYGSVQKDLYLKKKFNFVYI